MIIRSVLKVIDLVSEHTGTFAKWVGFGLILVLCYEVVMRYVFTAPTIWAHQTTKIMLGVMVSLGWAAVHSNHGNIRVDVMYSRVSPRKKAIIDFVCTLLFFFPVMTMLVYLSWTHMIHSWQINEIMMESYWYPPIGPSRTALFIGVLLLLIQGIAEFIRVSYFLFKGKNYDAKAALG